LEVFNGRHREIPNVELFSLRLPRKKGVVLRDDYSGNSSFRFDYQKIIDNYTADFQFKDDTLVMSGELFYKKSVNQYDNTAMDTFESDVLFLDSITIRVGRECITFDKYGMDEKSENIDFEKLRTEGVEDLLMGRPTIHIK
jgi:hypothetical protein